MNPVSRITGEGMAEFLRTWVPDFNQKRGGRGGMGAGTGGAGQFVRGNYISFLWGTGGGSVCSCVGGRALIYVCLHIIHALLSGTRYFDGKVPDIFNAEHSYVACVLLQ